MTEKDDDLEKKFETHEEKKNLVDSIFSQEAAPFIFKLIDHAHKKESEKKLVQKLDDLDLKQKDLELKQKELENKLQSSKKIFIIAIIALILSIFSFLFFLFQFIHTF